MGPLEILGTLAIWLTVKGWLRWKRSDRGALSSAHYSPSSPPTGAKPILPELDPDRTLHQSVCRWCRVQAYVPLRECRLEEGPWRLTWKCGHCRRWTRVRVAPQVLPMLLQQQRRFGMAIARREVADFAEAGLDELEAAIVEELW